MQLLLLTEKLLTSFQRQLNIYGFRKVKKGVDKDAYFHPFFQRDNESFLCKVKRMPSKGSLTTYETMIGALLSHPLAGLQFEHSSSVKSAEPHCQGRLQLDDSSATKYLDASTQIRESNVSIHVDRRVPSSEESFLSFNQSQLLVNEGVEVFPPLHYSFPKMNAIYYGGSFTRCSPPAIPNIFPRASFSTSHPFMLPYSSPRANTTRAYSQNVGNSSNGELRLEDSELQELNEVLLNCLSSDE
eukprot:gene15939-17960_t